MEKAKPARFQMKTRAPSIRDSEFYLKNLLPDGGSRDSKRLTEGGTLPGCIGTRNPYPPNRCDTCRRHSDYTCGDVKVVKTKR